MEGCTTLCTDAVLLVNLVPSAWKVIILTIDGDVVCLGDAGTVALDGERR